MKSKLLKTAIMVFVCAFVFVPFINVKALDGTTEVNDEAELVAALAKGENVSIKKDISLTAPILIDKEVTINGNDFTIDGTNIVVNGLNGTAVAASSKVTINNLKIANAPKYGIQSYNGGHVILNKVTISNCKFGAVLLNGGTATIKDLAMDTNGNALTGGNGIEFGKGVNVTGEPSLIMDGKLTATNQTNTIWIADNDSVGVVTVKNTDESIYRAAVDGNKVVIKDDKGLVVITSNEAKSGVKVEEKPIVEVENPDTADMNVVLMSTVGILSLIGLCVSTKKVFN